MSDSSETSRKPSREGSDSVASTAKEEAFSELAHAIDEARWARFRAQNRTRPLGFHGESFDRRDARVERIVSAFHARRIARARKAALRAGWTKEQLALAHRGDPDGEE